jgi:hypothetical protein
MTYCTLDQVKDELVLAYAVSSNDTELNNIIALIDSYINLRLQKYTSLPVNAEISAQLADIEARWSAARFRFRRATPQEQQQYQAALKNIEEEFQHFLNNNFRTGFRAVSSMTDRDARIDYGQFSD